MLSVNDSSAVQSSARPFQGTDETVLIIDDFLRNPGEVRTAALEMSYAPDVPAYPGVTATPNWDRESFASALSALLGRAVAAQDFGLRLSMVTKRAEELEPWQCVPHCDSVDLAGVVYLNLPEQCRGGTAFYRHRDSGLVQLFAQPDTRTLLFMVRNGIGTRDELLHLLTSPTDSAGGYITEPTPDWELLGLVEMRYNRLILYNGRCFHSGYIRDGDFGETKGERHLTLNYFLENQDSRAWKTSTAGAAARSLG